MENIIAGFKQTYGTAFAITSSVIIVMGMLFNESIASMMLAFAVMYPVVCILMALDIAVKIKSINQSVNMQCDEIAKALNKCDELLNKLNATETK